MAQEATIHCLQTHSLKKYLLGIPDISYSLKLLIFLPVIPTDVYEIVLSAAQN